MWNFCRKNTKKAAVACFWILLGGGLAFLAFRLACGALLPFVLAWGLSALLRTPLDFLCRHSRVPRRVISFFCLTAFLLLFGFGAFWLCDRLIGESGRLISSLAQEADARITRLFVLCDELIAKFPFLHRFGQQEELERALRDMIGAFLSSLGARVPAFLARTVAMLPDLLFFVLVFLIAAYRIAPDFHRINGGILSRLPEKVRIWVTSMLGAVKKAAGRTLRAYLLMLFGTFCIMYAGFSVLRVEFALTAAFLVALVDLLPILGVGTVLIPWGCFQLLAGQYYRGFGLLILFGIYTVVREIAEPHIVGTSIGLSPLATLIAMYSGYRLASFRGLIAFPILFLLVREGYVRYRAIADGEISAAAQP